MQNTSWFWKQVWTQQQNCLSHGVARQQHGLDSCSCKTDFQGYINLCTSTLCLIVSKIAMNEKEGFICATENQYMGFMASSPYEPDLVNWYKVFPFLPVKKNLSVHCLKGHYDVAKFFLSWNVLSCKRMLLPHSVVFASMSFPKSSFAHGVMKFLRVNNVCQLVFFRN